MYIYIYTYIYIVFLFNIVVKARMFWLSMASKEILSCLFNPFSLKI